MATLLVQSPEISRLLDDETGKQLDAISVVGSSRDQVMVLYKALHMSRKTGDGRLLCALCGVPVYMCSAPDRQHFFFKHFQEDGSCPAVTRTGMTEAQINALRYHGQRESKRHIRIKNLVADSLRTWNNRTPRVDGRRRCPGGSRGARHLTRRMPSSIGSMAQFDWPFRSLLGWSLCLRLRHSPRTTTRHCDVRSRAPSLTDLPP